MNSEKNLFNYYKRECKAHHVLCVKLVASGVTGWPDLFLACDGRITLVELKTPAKTGRLAERQKFMRSLLLRHGINVYVSDSKETADAIIAEITHTRTKQRD